MKSFKDIKAIVTAALLAAFTCVATMVIQIPTPALGYIHPGDCLVLLCGIILGPGLGALSAGVGSMLADLLSGYVIYAIPTLIIKGVTAAIAGIVFRKLKRKFSHSYAVFTLAGILAELNMVFGYFINKIVKTMFLAGLYNKETFSAGLAAAITDLLPNTIQGIVGIVLGLALFPILMKIPDVRLWTGEASNKENS
ncbi:MAG: ECF transporter S component [Clostridiales bacterium]|nr:ECF transporter S component [Clostridiales bacterium]